MQRRVDWVRYFALVAVLVLRATTAQATTSSCVGEANGTPCADSCIAAGVCRSQLCVPTTPRPDGTLCVTGNACTTGDHCQAGMCVVGAPVICPSESACRIGECNPQTGCFISDVCPFDLAVPPGSDLASNQDLSSSPSDLGDLATPADLRLVPNDMCVINPGVEFYTCNGADGFYTIPFDAGALHVRGSAVGDCALSWSATPPPWSVVLFLLLALAVARKRVPRR